MKPLFSLMLFGSFFTLSSFTFAANEVCTTDYLPVCGLQEVQCITTPCDPISNTFSNLCELQKSGATFLYNGECSDSLFSDVSDGYLYKEAIQYVKDQGIVNGYKDGTFKPNNAINRAEFLKIVIKVQFGDTFSEIENCNTKVFTDVNTSDWFFHYACFGKEKGIIKGYSDGRFKPSEDILFVEAAKIVVNTMIEKTEEGSGSAWYAPFVKILSNKKAIPDYVVDVEMPISRGYMAEFIWRVKTKREDQRYMAYQDDPCLCIPAGGDNMPTDPNDYKNHCGSDNCCSGLKVILPFTPLEKPKNFGDDFVYTSNPIFPDPRKCNVLMIGSICTPCGNNICDADFGENFCNCPADCKE